jgi:RNA polymerase sigma-70 factor (ECF subfamily)
MPTALDLFERHHLAVFRFLRRMGARPADAEDLTQQVFVNVLAALASYEERQLERAWVFRIARNVRLDQLRAERRTPTREPMDERFAAAVPAGAAERLDLDSALARLGESDREAFLLREVGGLGYREIASLTESSPDAVRSRIHRARLALREALAAGWRAAPPGAVPWTATWRGR